jgi:hypothetical protein
MIEVIRSGDSYSWAYENRLSGPPHGNIRVSKMVGAATTQEYKSSDKATKHIMLPKMWRGPKFNQTSLVNFELTIDYPELH